jgi:FkbM family methyltransferase
MIDPVNFRSLGYTVLCFKGLADVKLGKVAHNKEVLLALTHLKLCVDVARFELLSYWEIWHERCYDPIAIDRPECVVDVGANIGAFSLYQVMVKRAQLVIAFEPSPQVFPRLARNVLVNGLTNVRTVNAAVGDRVGVVTFSEGPLSMNGRVSESGSTSVPCVTLDQELSDIARVDILKIDTEGFEIRVLQGAIEILKKTDRVALELHYPGERQEIDSILLPLGFYLAETSNDLVFYRRRDSSSA